MSISIRARHALPLALAGSLAVTVLVSTEPASAESGRRVCSATEKQNQTLGGREYWVSVGLDYKKDGRCPILWPKDQEYYNSIGMPEGPPGLTKENPNPKVRCEDWPWNMGGTPWGNDDVCTQMEDDVPYIFYVDKLTGQTSEKRGSHLFNISW